MMQRGTRMMRMTRNSMYETIYLYEVPKRIDQRCY